MVRHGCFGKERKILLNKFLKNIIDNVLPNSAKFLLNSAQHDQETLGKDAKILKFLPIFINIFMEMNMILY